MSNKEILKKIETLVGLFDSGMIPTLAEHEVHPALDKSDRLNYIYFTLPVSINFQRSSPSMWKSALKTYEDPETNVLFYPEKVVTLPREKVQSLLLKHSLGLQRNKHTDIWIGISNTLNKYFNNDPRELINKNDSDVVKVIELLQKTMKKDFPYLSGPKLSNYWLYILSRYTDINLKNRHRISIIPDTHVIQSSIILGLAEQKLQPDKLEILWNELLQDSKLAPVDIHPVLWNWSRNNFQPGV